MNVSTLLTVAALIIPAGAVLAQAGGMQSADTSAAPAKNTQTPVYKATGVVKKVDPAKGTVTLAHGPVRELNWPGMTMMFAVKDKTLFSKLVVDRKVEFEFAPQGTNYVVTTVK